MDASTWPKQHHPQQPAHHHPLPGHLGQKQPPPEDFKSVVLLEVGVMAPMGMAPMGMAPMGMAPMGMAPMGMAPMGMAPMGMA